LRHPAALAVYAVAMGILESIVVVYLRRLYYPDGFGFPLAPMDPSVLHCEVIREAMTLIMLVAVAWIAAPTLWGRLIGFLVAFGVWDLSYYAGLKVFLDWPAGLLTPDILFLIPKVWVGPVLAPALVAAAWVIGGLSLHRARYADLGMSWKMWSAGILASLVIVLSFLIPVGRADRPGFSWPLFGTGYILGLAVLARLVARARRVPRW
jgi:hypothetical protein